MPVYKLCSGNQRFLSFVSLAICYTWLKALFLINLEFVFRIAEGLFDEEQWCYPKYHTEDACDY